MSTNSQPQPNIENEVANKGQMKDMTSKDICEKDNKQSGELDEGCIIVARISVNYGDNAVANSIDDLFSQYAYTGGSFSFEKRSEDEKNILESQVCSPFSRRIKTIQKASTFGSMIGNERHYQFLGKKV